MVNFHPLSDDAPETYRLPDGAPVDIANRPDKDPSTKKGSFEAPCTEEDGKPMNADSFHHRK